MEYFIEDITDEGNGVAKVDRKVYFIEGAVLGEVCEAELVEQKKSFAVMKKTKTVKPSPFLTEAKCRHFDECDGCTFQNIHYIRQLQFKKDKIENAVQRIGKYEPGEIGVIPGEEYFYRNKINLKCEDDTLGYYNRNSHSFVPVTECPVAGPTISSAFDGIRKAFEEEGTKRIEEIEIRENGDEIQLGIAGKPSSELTERLKEMPEIVSISLKTGKGYDEIYKKKDFIMTLGDKKYKVGQDSFFQINREVAKKVYDRIKDQIEPGDHVVDLYCGIGAIGIYVSGKAEKVTGIEVNRRAVEDAKVNAALNGVKNATFYRGKAEKIFAQDFDGDVLIVDPPRGGLHKNLVKKINASNFDRLIYMSCNPATFARDLRRLKAGGFRMEEITGADMFPQTIHTECVALFRR